MQGTFTRRKMIGFIVKHAGFGLGKVVELNHGQVVVSFFSPPQTLRFSTDYRRPVVVRRMLALGTVCAATDGKCKITKVLPIAAASESYRYQVELDSGLTKEASEVELTPEPHSLPSSPLEALGDLHLEGYITFQKREVLADAWWSSIRLALGLRALLSSRIDLLPHQAYVAGTVLMDRLPRYLLADEVGLGKTIEAGIIIHDLLERNPSAKILILCPSTLTQQWLCELYSKFSGRIFALLELRGRAVELGAIPDKVIASYPAALKCSSHLHRTKWDMVVVDEAHHLLNSQQLYSLAQRLSAAAPGCLLLSAIPAQRREEEYFRLLALLEPDRYKPDSPGEKERFRELYARQNDLGRKLSYLSRRLGEHAAGDGDPVLLIKKIAELAALPVLAQDNSLAALAKALDPVSPRFIASARAILHHVGDRYRISRRILRNRRSQLLDSEPDLKISRSLHRLPFAPDQLEIDAANSVRRLLHTLREQNVGDSVLLPLARYLYQSLCDPKCLCGFLQFSHSAEGVQSEFLEFDGHVSYQGWEEYVSTLWEAVALKLPRDELGLLVRAAESWQSGVEGSARFQALLPFLRQKNRQQPNRKFIIFAGYPGLSQRLAGALRIEFGPVSVAEFSWSLESRQKEREVIRFKRDTQCWLMVSDETGGEGRNFQFADELIHYDLPWHVSKVEQRIGRLDRLGRSSGEVCSNVLVSSGGEEEGLLACLSDGFQIFTQSISGLEFAISHLEKKIIQVAITDGFEGLAPLATSVRAESVAERAEDDVQAMLDAASLERVAAEEFKRAQSTPERDVALERAFADYFRFIGGDSALKFIQAGDYPEGIIEFRPNQVREVTLNLPAEPNGSSGDRLGTFRREIAQERPDLQFFSVGNEFFDAVCASLQQSAQGRTYAVECIWSSGKWRGFEFAYRPVGRRAMLDFHPGLMKHLDRLFSIRLEHCFVEESIKLAPNQSVLLKVRRELKQQDKDIKWRNFTLKNGRVQLLAERYPDWSQRVQQAEQLARASVRERFAQQLAPAMEQERKRIEEQIRQARHSRSDGWDSEVIGLEALLAAMEGWDLELDLAGFFSLNGGLIP